MERNNSSGVPTDHCGVQERGDVKDFVQSQCRVDASVVFASTKNTQTSVTQKEEKSMATFTPFHQSSSKR